MKHKLGSFTTAAALGLMLAPVTAFAGVGERPGEHFEIRLEDLPAPHATKGVAKFPEKVDRADHVLAAPDGFAITIFADGLVYPRGLVIAPNGDIFVSQPTNRFAKGAVANIVTVLRDEDGDGKADKTATFADGFNLPQGMAFVDGALLVADVQGVWRLPYEKGALAATMRDRLTPEGALGGEKTGAHWQRNLAVAPAGDTMYVTVGSMSNVAEDPMPHATVQRFRLDGSDATTFASGLRNASALAFNPTTSELYTVVNERDMLGDGLVPDYLTRIRDGEFYGWPYAYADARPDPDFAAKRPDMVAKTSTPDVLFDAHSAPTGLAFYTGQQFPEDYRGDAFVSLHGSWNKSAPTGYKVVRVQFENGRPVAGYDNFITGWLVGMGDRPQAWGRPAGLAVAPDGSLLIADDTSGIVWRVSYVGN